MRDLLKAAEELQAKLQADLNNLDYDNLADELAELDKKTSSPDFWSDSKRAQAAAKKQAKLRTLIGPWRQLKDSLSELIELIKLGDNSLEADLGSQLKNIEAQYREQTALLAISGPYDSHDAIISIHAGAGGVDAQDWASMLARMYLRWAASRNYQTRVLNESTGEEAGLKSIDINIEGENVYGQLKGEHGVHRLVRLSPFNADNLRQTSFAKVEVLPKIDEPSDLEIDSSELKIDVFRSGGKGGQSVNTTDSAVRVTHIPTGINVAIQNERSQLQNKETAMTVLRSKLASLKLEQHKEKLSELKGPVQSAEWGNQIRSYVLHPYKQVKDLRTKYESKEPQKVLGGDIDGFIKAYQSVLSN